MSITGRDTYLFLDACLGTGSLEGETTEGRRDRQAVLDKSLAARIYWPRLTEYWTLLKTRYGAAAEEISGLAVADEAFNRCGRGLQACLTAYECWDEAPQGLAEAAARVKAAFVPSAEVWTQSYADEVALLGVLKTALIEHRPALEALGPLALGLAEGMVNTLAHLATLMEAKGSQIPTTLPTGFHGRVQGELSAFRQALAAEVLTNPELPPHAEAKVFGYLDLLKARRQPKAKPAR